MFYSHRRNKSLISVSNMERSEKKEPKAESKEKETLEIDEDDLQTPRQKRNVTMIYLLFLAAAIMESSLSSQIAVLVPSTTGCLSMNTQFPRSILQCAYYFGSAMGLFWGCAADRSGRRTVALVGLTGMSICCISMGFVIDFLGFAIVRCVVGITSSAVTVSGLAMLADSRTGVRPELRSLPRLPMIAACGSIGTLASHMWQRAFDGHFYDVFAKYPGLSGQIACASLVLSITIAEVVLLEEVRFHMLSIYMTSMLTTIHRHFQPQFWHARAAKTTQTPTKQPFSASPCSTTLRIH